ncbi:MAG: AI-2E family transporter [Propionibacteriaceae bacterium]|nr:AI-2E family transporter [Propionibacteriaceae bacterium]
MRELLTMALSHSDELPVDETMPTDRGRMVPRALSILLGLMAVVLAAQGIQPIKSTFAAAFLALNVVIVVFPIQHYLSKIVPRFLASLVAGLTAIAILVALVWTVGWTIASLIKELPKYSSQFNLMISETVGLAESFNINTNLLVEEGINRLRGLELSTITSTLGGIAAGLSSFLGIMFMIALVLIFMVIDSVGFSERMKRLGERHNPTLAWGLSSFAKGTRKYWVVSTVFGVIVGICNWILLVVLGVPLAGVWAVFSFVTNYIPNVGFLLGVVPPVLMALLATDPWTALWVVVGYCVFTGIQNLVQPKFAGDAVGITPTMAVLSLFLWAYILGPLGAILAIPATLLVKTIFIDIDPRNRWLNAFIASNPHTSDQDPMKLSNILARTKRMRKLSARVQKPGVSAEDALAAQEELEALEVDHAADHDDEFADSILPHHH